MAESRYLKMHQIFSDPEHQIQRDELTSFLLDFDPVAREDDLRRKRTTDVGEIIVRTLDPEDPGMPLQVSIAQHDMGDRESTLTVKFDVMNPNTARLVQFDDEAMWFPRSWRQYASETEPFLSWEELFRFLLWFEIDIALAW